MELADVDLGRLSSFLGFRLRRVQNKLSRDFQIKTRAWKLRAGMFSALEIVNANPGISQTDLAREIGLDKSPMVSLVDELQERGWIRRERSPTDRRRHMLSITSDGKVTLDALFVELATTEATILHVLPKPERDLILTALDHVYRAYVRAGDR